MTKSMSRLIRAQDFILDYKYDTFFEQLAIRIQSVSGLKSLNVFSSCSKLRDNFFTSHFTYGEGNLSNFKKVTAKKLEELKELYECTEFRFKIHNSESVSFVLLHDGEEVTFSNPCRKTIRRLIEATSNNKLQELRDLIVGASFKHEQLEDFLYYFLSEILPKFFKVEGASIFYEEEGSRNLCLLYTSDAADE